MTTFVRREVKIDDEVTLSVLTAGAESGVPLLFLHGFPDFSHGWRHQLPFFAHAGYRVIAPDLHGYAGSSKPQALDRYRLDAIGTDILKMLGALGVERCHVVGHDWGAGLTWQLLGVAPERFETATVICVPHLKVFFDYISTNKRGQALRSWYMLFFQLPVLPELLFKRQDGKWLAAMLAKSSRKGTFTAEDQAAYAAAWQTPGAATAMLNWYRANVIGGRKRARAATTGKVKPPVLIVWGDQDVALNHYMAEDSAKMCESARVLHFEKGTHWVHMEFARAVNVAILEHVKNAVVKGA